MTISVRATDLGPLLVATLLDDSGAAVNLTNANVVTLRMRRRDSAVLAIADGAMTVLSPASDGKASYAWQAADTEVGDIGSYWAVVRVLWNDGTPQTFPAPDLLSIEVLGDLASLPTITDAQLAAVRRHVGSDAPPSDLDIARALARLGTPEAVAQEVLEGRLADLLSGPAKWSLDGDMSVEVTTAQIEALTARLAEVKDLVSATASVPSPWFGGLTVAEHESPDDGYVRGHFRETYDSR